VAPRKKPYFFGVIRRAQTALEEYESGREQLVIYVSGPKTTVSKYFRALSHFEHVLALTYQAIDLAKRVSGARDPFSKNDGTAIERLNRLYNVSKHLEESTVEDKQLHAVWLQEDGIHCSTCSLAWSELAEIVACVAEVADMFSDFNKIIEWKSKNPVEGPKDTGG
jgi:hypothetical protein